jgi:hypothetical protein
LRGFPWVIWAFMLAADIALVARYGNNFPFQDDWTLVPVLTGCQDVNWSWVWYQHNEHRLPLAKLAIVGLGHISGNNFRTVMFVNVGLLALAAALLIWASSFVNGALRWTDAFYPLVLLHWGHADNFLWAWQIGFIIALVVVLIWLAVLIGTGGNYQPHGMLLAIVALLLPLCGGVGMCFLPFLIIWLLCRAFAGRMSADRCWALAGAGAGLLMAALYSRGYSTEYSAPASTTKDILEAAVQFVSLGLGMAGSLGWRAMSIGMLIGLALGLILLITSLRQSSGSLIMVGGRLCFLGGFLLLAAAIGWGRAGIGTEAALAGRYVTLASLGACWLYSVVVVDARMIVRRYLPVLFLALAACMLWPNTSAGYRHALGLRQIYSAFKADMAAGMPPVALTEKYNTAPRAIGFSYVIRRFPGWLVMMHDSDHPEFQRLKSELPTRTITVSASPESIQGRRRFVLPSQMFVYAVRLKSENREQAQYSHVDLQCGPAAIHGLREVDGRTFQITSPRPIFLWWVNQQTAGFDLTTDATSVDASDIEVLISG